MDCRATLYVLVNAASPSNVSRTQTQSKEPEYQLDSLKNQGGLDGKVYLIRYSLGALIKIKEK